MAISNSEKQRNYRLNRFKRGKYGDYRVNTFVKFEAYIGLERLASHYKITKRQVLESLIITADKTIFNSFDMDSDEFKKYINIDECD